MSACVRIPAARLLTALVLLPVMLVVVSLPALRVVFALVAATFVFQGLREFYAIAGARGVVCERWAGIFAGTAVALSAMLDAEGLTALVLCIALLALCVVEVLRGRLSIAGMATSVFGVVYVGWFGAHIVLLHRLPQVGPGLVVLLILTVALSDSGAYLVGSTFGRHKLAPEVSPNKSWEGAAGGVVFAVLAVLLAYGVHGAMNWEGLPDWSLPAYLGLAVALSVIGQFGDLAESALKRDAGVKDSGAIFPGHGGMLDRCDSFLFAAPILYYIAAPWAM